MRATGALGLAVLALAGAAPGCRPRGAPPVLLFDGAGTSRNDVAAVEAVLRRAGIDYATVGSAELDELPDERLRAARLLIVPGGDFLAIGGHLRPATAARLHRAVNDGLGYLGICAGAFFAGGAPDYTSLDLTAGVKFHFYSAEERGVRKAAVPIAVAETGTLEQYWEDGPELSGWGEVVGRYPDGKPAIVQGRSGRGWVVLSGVHPEAPESWRAGMTFATPAEIDNAFAAALVQAALDQRPLPHD